jgi:hypothetical protein
MAETKATKELRTLIESFEKALNEPTNIFLKDKYNSSKKPGI